MDVPVPISPRDVKEQGRDAYRRGGRPSQNPYAEGSPEFCRAWAEGFKEAYYHDGLRGQPA